MTTGTQRRAPKRLSCYASSPERAPCWSSASARAVSRFPLASLGLQMHGIDSSDAMVAKLRERPGGDSVAVTLGDFQDFDLAERFSLVLVVQYVFHTA